MPIYKGPSCIRRGGSMCSNCVLHGYPIWFTVVEQLKNDDRFTELLGHAYDQRRVIRSYEWNEIPVTGYRRLIHFRSDTTENHGELLITNGDEIICLDIRPYLQEIKEKGSGEQKETAENMTYRVNENRILHFCLLYTSPSPRDRG